MGLFIRHGRRKLLCIPILALICLQGGCQFVGMPNVSPKKLVRYQQMLDLSGLKDIETNEHVRVKVATPKSWEALPVYKAALYTHQQWRSQTHRNGVGVVYIRMPFPFSASTLTWLAEREYSKRADDGKVVAQWTDSIGRPWFEVENKKFHVRGYVMTTGLDAWIVYAGYRVLEQPEPEEISLSSRSLESIVPIPRGEEISPATSKESEAQVSSNPNSETRMTNQ
ncbi:MAG TPA: hypothetical protein VL282_02075 [Tepidisphaeraceae bacterium]|jgi:hypothetical protein|nr:hypothetical protein [Tepidisphaeraceae bacterium]